MFEMSQAVARRVPNKTFAHDSPIAISAPVTILFLLHPLLLHCQESIRCRGSVSILRKDQPALNVDRSTPSSPATAEISGRPAHTDLRKADVAKSLDVQRGWLSGGEILEAEGYADLAKLVRHFVADMEASLIREEQLAANIQHPTRSNFREADRSR
jgi:hypothetical protein